MTELFVGAAVVVGTCSELATEGRVVNPGLERLLSANMAASAAWMVA